MYEMKVWSPSDSFDKYIHYSYVNGQWLGNLWGYTVHIYMHLPGPAQLSLFIDPIQEHDYSRANTRIISFTKCKLRVSIIIIGYKIFVSRDPVYPFSTLVSD